MITDHDRLVGQLKIQGLTPRAAKREARRRGKWHRLLAVGRALKARERQDQADPAPLLGPFSQAARITVGRAQQSENSVPPYPDGLK